MNFRRVIGLTAIALSLVLWAACGQVYRPVVIPTTTTPPNPANFHSVLAVNDNLPLNPGSAMEIDVHGDSIVAETGGLGSTVGHIGVHPTHAMILPNLSRVFVANAGSLDQTGTDVITSFTPEIGSSALGFTSLTTFALPNVVGESFTITAISENGNTVTVTLSSSAVVNAGAVIVISGVPVSGYNGTFTVTGGGGNIVTYSDSLVNLVATSGGTASISPTFCRYLPDFVTAAQNNIVYAANYGVEGDPNCNLGSTDSIAVLDSALNSITNIVYVAGSHPVALAEVQSPTGDKLYVANQGTNSIGSFNTVDMTPNTVTLSGTPFSANTPVWLVARGDGKRVYALTQGDGQLVPIDTATDTVLASQTNLSVGAGANFILYDPHLNRLYVTNPVNGNVYVFSAIGGLDPTTGKANDTPTLLATISLNGGATSPCPGGCSPVSVTALPDGSRFYVASYATPTSCPDSHVSGACVVPRLTVIDAQNFSFKVPALFLLTSPPFASGQFAVLPVTSPSVSSCVATSPYTPGPARFRMFAAAAADSSRVHVSICDAGVVAVVNTTTNTITQGGTNVPDTLLTNLPAPFSASSPGPNGQPAPQNPVFLLAGQ
jgi:DNA-binding beta-propeller fold protein YncE